MRLVEQTIIRKDDPRYAAIDAAAFASKNLYNQANYQIRQAYIHEGKYLPYAQIFHRLTYKAQLVGITVLVHEESYTSKASFLDLDEIPTYDPQHIEPPRFSGKRINRGYYQASDKCLIHADVNGSYNIARKVFPTAFGPGIAASYAVRPRRLAV
jgi:putative transposase